MLKANYSFIFIIGFLCILALFIGGTFFYSILLLSIIIVLLSYIMGCKAYKNLICIVWDRHKQAIVGDKVEFSIQLYNSGIIPFSHLVARTNLPLKLTGQYEKPLIGSIRAGGKLNINKSITCRHKGLYDVGIIEAEFSDMFGFFSWKKCFQEDITLLVYPKIPILEEFDMPVRQHFGTVPSKNRTYEDFASVKDLRKYAFGDSLKKVNWKVSAHRNEIYVKNLELNASANVHIFMDSYCQNFIEFQYEMEEKAAEISLAIIRYALTRSMAVEFYTADKETVSIIGKGINQFSQFLDVISRLSANGDMPIYEIVRKEARKLNYAATLVIITAKVDEQFGKLMYSLKMAGMYIVVIYISREYEEDNYNFENICKLGIKAFKIGIDDDVRLRLGGRYES